MTLPQNVRRAGLTPFKTEHESQKRNNLKKNGPFQDVRQNIGPGLIPVPIWVLSLLSFWRVDVMFVQTFFSVVLFVAWDDLQ